jgi:uncharacterized protein DUF659
VENPEFHDFIHHLNSAYSLPSHEVIGASILEKVYGEVIYENQKQLTGKLCVIQQDGWSTNQNQLVIAHTLSSMQGSFFLSAEVVGGSKTAEACFELIKNAKETAEEKYGCEVIGVITDNCASMVNMQAIIKDKLDNMESYGCHAHRANLLGQKFTPKTLMESVATVHGYFRNHHFPSEKFREMKGGRPVQPGTTRWNSEIDAFISYCSNHSNYLSIIRQVKEPSTKAERMKLSVVRNILNDSTIYEDLQLAIKTLKPICIAIDKVAFMIFDVGAQL